MATIMIPEAVQAYFPKTVEPSQLWVNYNPMADSLTIYFTGKPVPSIWTDVDEFAYIGFALNDETTVTGVMIEHFSKWLLVPGYSAREWEPA
ncbi:MAG: DUF2283 domain-containing protein [Anaerolineae bacterium]|nr:DUF2283 domain-containing protein [Anaerolineae bacterium]